ncbi:MAG: SEC-C domain-containing protein [Bacilli bacterium]|nr:SEC-C domain-containing protein [Bacilli bacterium]
MPSARFPKCCRKLPSAFNSQKEPQNALESYQNTYYKKLCRSGKKYKNCCGR